MLANEFPDEAGRLAYGGGLHAAHAYVFERTGKVPKTHAGAHAEFSRVTRDDETFTESTRRFLGRTDRLKAAADYGEGLTADMSAGKEAVAMARQVVDAVETSLNDRGDKP